MSLLDHNDEEKEVSTGSVIGKILVIAAVLFILVFIVFVIFKSRTSSTASVDLIVNSIMTNVV